MKFLVMIIVPVIILVVFAGIICLTGFIFLKLKDHLTKLVLQKKSGNVKFICNECQRIFKPHESMKTLAGIYPCPDCAGKNTVNISS